METVRFNKQNYEITHEDVFFNCEIQKYVHRRSRLNKGLIFGVINFENNNLIFGFFKKNIYNNCRLHFNGPDYICNSFEFLIYNKDFKWSSSHELFIYDPEGTYTPTVLKRKSEERAYNLEDNSDYPELVRLQNNYKLELNKGLYIYKNLLKNYTFGIELETNSGRVFPWTKYRYGFSECRDGSIDNTEYVSVPLKGLKGIQSIINFCNENKNLITTDYKCSMHIHIGNIPTNKWFICALYNFLYSFQNDYFDYFPLYKKDNSVLNKNKHYTKPLLSLTTNIDFKEDKENILKTLNRNLHNIFIFLTDGVEPQNKFNRKNRKHPQKQKWNIVNRYFFCNLVNLLFGERKTVEFRIHENTFNSEKILNHLILSIAILNYVENNIKLCLEGKNIKTVNEILNYYIKDDTLYENLFSYYENRKELFQSDKEGVFETYCNE